MIKLTDLLRELDLRSGELGGSFVNDTSLYISFFNNFNFENAELMDELSSEQLKTVFNSEADQSEVRGKVLSEVNDYQLLDPGIGMTLYIVNTSAKTWKEYIVGSVDVEVMNNKPYKLKGGQIILTYISKPYRGKGIGTLMYYMVLAHYRTLFSDEILYEGSRKVWLSKIYSAANFFGAQALDFYIPLTLEDAQDDNLVGSPAILSYVASINPSPEMIKLDNTLGGLSLSKGEFGVYEYPGNTNAFFDVIEGLDDLSDVVESYELVSMFNANDQPNALVVRTSDAVCVVKDAGNKLDVTVI
jgi:GNAT superfamily N-acetyltransferase